MLTTTSLTEQEILVLGSCYAKESLSLHFFSSQRTGTVYFLTDNLYNEAYRLSPNEWGRDGGMVSNDVQGGAIPAGGIDKFIETILADKKCLAIVPLMEGARKALEARRLRVTMTGLTLKPENIAFNAYGG